MFIGIIELLGGIAFAVSGAVKGLKYKLDILGVLVLGVITAIGGGIIRDIILNDSIPLAFRNEKAIIYPLLASAFAFLFSCKIENYSKVVKVFDAAGLAVFTIIGVNRGLENNLGLTALIIMGTLTGVAGGVIRDILVGEIPFILKEELYAILCIIGSLIYVFLIKRIGVDKDIATYVVIGIIFVSRLTAMKFNLHLPKKSLKNF